jgi:hypothetical protein
MSRFRRSNRVPGAREGGVAAMSDLADLTDPRAVDALLMELDDLRSTVYRQDCRLREEDARAGRMGAAARADEHRKALVVVAAMSALAASDPDAPPEVRAFAARVEAALARVAPQPLPPPRP